MLDDADFEALCRWGESNIPRANLATVIRIIILQRLASEKVHGGSNPLPKRSTEDHGGPQDPSSPDLLDLGRRREEGKKREKERTTADHGGPSRKRRTRQTELIEDEATTIARAVVERVNQLRGTGFTTTTPAFGEVAHNVRSCLSAGSYTAEDFVRVVDDQWRLYQGKGERERNVNPTTLTRPGNFPRYLAEVGQPVASAAPARGRVVGESANVEQLLLGAEKTPEQKWKEREELCRKLGVHA